MKKTLIVLVAIVTLLIGYTLFSSYRIKKERNVIAKNNKELLEWNKIHNQNINMTTSLNIKNDVDSVSSLIGGSSIVDSLLTNDDRFLVLWVRDDHCMSCVESIYKVIEKYKDRNGFKLVILTKFEIARNFKFFKKQIPTSFSIVNNPKGYPNYVAFNISMPVMFFKEKKSLKHFFIADKNLPRLTALYLENICEKYFDEQKEKYVIRLD